MGDKKKKAQMFVKLVSAAGTGFFYEKRKPRQFTEKLEFRKFDPRVNRHVLFTEAKMNQKTGTVRSTVKLGCRRRAKKEKVALTLVNLPPMVTVIAGGCPSLTERGRATVA
ncbi:uncharacterized protein HKW66_Vig0218330 [Vigna angularis]|uniref:50S ribosomal protein L33, chloroplastic n=1 Tax=Phaseolus angularis TaxID=3914 RepID=A0A8T0JES5_PHAAN|nr:uncharacterized protein HKW66_Vig0218330 [Vigna angularis]